MGQVNLLSPGTKECGSSSVFLGLAILMGVYTLNLEPLRNSELWAMMIAAFCANHTFVKLQGRRGTPPSQL